MYRSSNQAARQALPSAVDRVPDVPEPVPTHRRELGGEPPTEMSSSGAALNAAALPNNPMNFTENQQGTTILERLRVQKESGRFCDVVLHVQGKQFQAHRNVLATCSPYFDSVLKTQKTVKEQLTVTCNNHEAFGCLLNYMYTGHVVIDKNNVAELLRLANHFLLAKLKSYCAEYLDRYLDVTNCLSVKEMGERYSMPMLVKNATRFIQSRVADVLQHKELLESPLPKVEQFLSDKNWTIPQDGLIKFTCQWVAYNPTCRERDLRTLMTFVNWHAVERNFVASHIDTEPLFKQNPRCCFFILQSLEENGIQVPKYAATYQELKAKFGPEATGGSFDSDSFLNMAISTAIEGFQESGGPSPVDREADTTFDPVTVTALGKDALLDLSKSTRNASTSKLSANGSSKKKSFSGATIIPAALLLKGRKRVKPIKLKLGGSLRKKLEISTCSTVTTTKGRKLKVVRLKRTQKKALYGQLKRAGLVGNGGQKSGKAVGAPGSLEFESSDDEDEEILTVRSRKKSCHSSDFFREGIKCPHCSFVAHGVVRLEQHVAMVHSRDVTYKCGLCEYTCKWNKEYYTHMKQRHFEGPPFRCDGCEFSCDRIQMLLTHRLKHSDDRPFKCQECEYRCRTKNNLLAHARSHSAERPYKCHVCGRSFAVKGTLDQHLAIHGDQRPFQCDVCGFSTKYQSHLIAHRRIHTGEIFRCDFPECSYSSQKKSQLSAHNRTHTAIRSHVCGVCGRGFVEKSHLVRHERIHLNEKPFKCDHCDYSSSRRDKLKEHQQKHHGAHPTAKTPYKPRKPRTSGGSGGSGTSASPGKQHPHNHHHHHHHHHHHPYESSGVYGSTSGRGGNSDLDHAVLHQVHGGPQTSQQQQHGQQQQQQQQQQMSQTPTPSSTMSESSPSYTYDQQASQHHLAAAMDLHSKVIIPDLSRSLAAVAAAAAAGAAEQQGGQQQGGSGGQQQGGSGGPPNQAPQPPPTVSSGTGSLPPPPPHTHSVAVARGQPPTMVFDPRYHTAGPTFHHHIPPGLDQRPQQPGMHNLNSQAGPNLPHPSDFSGLSAFMALF